jgi:hypothetical protein
MLKKANTIISALSDGAGSSQNKQNHKGGG